MWRYARPRKPPSRRGAFRRAGHECLAPGVFLTTWSDGTRLLTNYGPNPFSFEGRTVAPLDFALIDPK